MADSATDLGKATDTSAAKSGAVLPDSALNAAPEAVAKVAPDLARTVRRWPAWSETVRAAIVAMTVSEGDGRTS